MANDLILVLNCGSSSLKGALIDNKTGGLILSCLAEKLTTPDAYITFKYFDNADIRPAARRSWFVERKDGDKHEVSLSDRHDHTGAVEALLEELRAHDLQDMVRAIGHRVVHGGEKYSGSVVIDDKVMAVLEECIPLAPLHNPANLTGIRAAQSIFPGLINVGVFDTAFHQTMPEHAYTYAVPQELYRKYGFRRYGFHGTSFRYVAPVAAEIIGKDINDCSLVIAHLGNGASVCAVKNGESQDTSMGVTPLEGLVMGTRSGDLDPSTCSFLADNAGMDVKAVTDMLNKKSGLLGISGLSNDCRTIQEAAAEGHAGAKLALEVMTYRLAKYIAAMAVATNGIDALVFTGGIGENSDVVRSKTVNYLGFLGLTIDEEANKATRFGASGIISQKGREPAVVVVPTNEERMIAMDTGRLAGL
ncbi:acetate kinase [Neisseria canis]|uniref:Acetate kinase n=1 Tax=Neisseria canis TaxID=493 RepID=A0A1X3CX26_9NEIS|nr:acetate kinase [Neisseria canis]OSI12178.1 acetate kinase [Neisseria canis]VEF01261.1 acetate kinase [Neisseria canis]